MKYTAKEGGKTTDDAEPDEAAPPPLLPSQRAQHAVSRQGNDLTVLSQQKVCRQHHMPHMRYLGLVDVFARKEWGIPFRFDALKRAPAGPKLLRRDSRIGKYASAVASAAGVCIPGGVKDLSVEWSVAFERQMVVKVRRDEEQGEKCRRGAWRRECRDSEFESDSGQQLSRECREHGRIRSR